MEFNLKKLISVILFFALSAVPTFAVASQISTDMSFAYPNTSPKISSNLNVNVDDSLVVYFDTEYNLEKKWLYNNKNDAVFVVFSIDSELNPELMMKDSLSSFEEVDLGDGYNHYCAYFDGYIGSSSVGFEINPSDVGMFDCTVRYWRLKSRDENLSYDENVFKYSYSSFSPKDVLYKIKVIDEEDINSLLSASFADDADERLYTIDFDKFDDVGSSYILIDIQTSMNLNFEAIKLSNLIKLQDDDVESGVLNRPTISQLAISSQGRGKEHKTEGSGPTFVSYNIEASDEEIEHNYFCIQDTDSKAQINYQINCEIAGQYAINQKVYELSDIDLSFDGEKNVDRYVLRELKKYSKADTISVN
jgi:hypothetical protein